MEDVEIHYRNERKRELSHYCKHVLYPYTADEIIKYRKELWAELDQLGITGTLYKGFFARPSARTVPREKRVIDLSKINLESDTYAQATRNTCKEMYYPDDEDWERYLSMYYPFVHKDNLHLYDYVLEDRLAEKNLHTLLPRAEEMQFLPDPLEKLARLPTLKNGIEKPVPENLLLLIQRMRGELFHLLDQGTATRSYEDLQQPIDWRQIWSFAKQKFPNHWKEVKYGIEITVHRAMYSRENVLNAVEKYLQGVGEERKVRNTKDAPKAVSPLEKYLPLILQKQNYGHHRNDKPALLLHEDTVTRGEKDLDRWQENNPL